MKLPRVLILIVLALAVASPLAFAEAVSGRYPSPYVDHWANVVSPTSDLRGGTVDCDPVLAAMKAAGLKRFIFSAGSYLFTPGGTQSITGGDGETYEGAGPGATTIVCQDNDTGVWLLAGNDTVVRNLKIDAFDDAGTVAVRLATGKHRILYENVEITDFATAIQDGGDVVNGITLRGCNLSSNGYGFRTAAASTGITISGGRMTNNATAAIGLQAGPNGGSIRGVSFEGNGADIQMGSCSNYVIGQNDHISGTTSISISTGARNAIEDSRWGYDEILPSDVAGQQTSLRGVYYATSSPAAGNWETGDFVRNSSAGTNTTSPLGWLCTNGGAETFQAVYRGLPITSGTATWDPDSLNEGDEDTFTSAGFTGVAAGDPVAWGFSQTIPPGVVMTVQATGTNTITVNLVNVAGGAGVDVGSGTLTVRAIQ